MYIDVKIGSPHRSPASVTMGPVSRWSGDAETRPAVTQRTDRVMLLQPPGSDFYMLPHTLRTWGMADYLDLWSLQSSHSPLPVKQQFDIDLTTPCMGLC